MKRKPKTKSHKANFRLREDQWLQLEKEAKELGAPSVSALILAKVMSQTNVRLSDPKNDKELITALIKCTAATLHIATEAERKEVLRNSKLAFQAVAKSRK